MLSPNIKAQLLAASAAPQKVINPGFNQLLSYGGLHKIYGRATPDQLTKYRHSLILHKVHNDQNQGSDWVSINCNQNFNSRQQNIFFFTTNSYKIGNNLFAYRLSILNRNIKCDMLNHA